MKPARDFGSTGWSSRLGGFTLLEILLALVIGSGLGFLLGHSSLWMLENASRLEELRLKDEFWGEFESSLQNDFLVGEERSLRSTGENQIELTLHRAESKVIYRISESQAIRFADPSRGRPTVWEWGSRWDNRMLIHTSPDRRWVWMSARQGDRLVWTISLNDLFSGE